VLSAPRTGKLATLRADGRPVVVPIWVAVDGDDIVFNAGETTAKVKSIRRDPRVSICFDDEQPPFAFVTVEGTASLSDDLGEVKQWATVIGGRYMGADRADEFGARNGVPGELLVRVTPTRVIGETAVSD
jgi:PPOX class probable F420-dependent enzyme